MFHVFLSRVVSFDLQIKNWPLKGGEIQIEVRYLLLENIGKIDFILRMLIMLYKLWVIEQGGSPIQLLTAPKVV